MLSYARSPADLRVNANFYMFDGLLGLYSIQKPLFVRLWRFLPSSSRSFCSVFSRIVCNTAQKYHYVPFLVLFFQITTISVLVFNLASSRRINPLLSLSRAHLVYDTPDPLWFLTKSVVIRLHSKSCTERRGLSIFRSTHFK